MTVDATQLRKQITEVNKLRKKGLTDEKILEQHPELAKALAYAAEGADPTVLRTLVTEAVKLLNQGKSPAEIVKERPDLERTIAFATDHARPRGSGASGRDPVVIEHSVLL